MLFSPIHPMHIPDGFLSVLVSIFFWLISVIVIGFALKKTTKQLAAEMDLSVTAVFERIKKLEKQQIIKSYVALLNPEKIQKDFIVLCQ